MVVSLVCFFFLGLLWCNFVWIDNWFGGFWGGFGRLACGCVLVLLVSLGVMMDRC